mmetsp:Transcript_10363/g.13895  ORF Transcript_10363/g.13895 Transcript_10363/m.13895 type:complete len:636 (+) Transcript_10363:63-1970(+)
MEEKGVGEKIIPTVGLPLLKTAEFALHLAEPRSAEKEKEKENKEKEKEKSGSGIQQPKTKKRERKLFHKKKKQNYVKITNTDTEEDVPLIMSDCLEEVRGRGLECEGIFRISGKKEDVDLIKKSYEKGKPVSLSDHDIHAVTGALKQYLREMKTPLMTFELYEAFLEAYQLDSEAQLIGIKVSVDRLPPGNRRCVQKLMEVLHQATKQIETNKMSSENLSIVITPSIMWSQGEVSATELTNTQNATQLVGRIIEEYPTVFAFGDILDSQIEDLPEGSRFQDTLRKGEMALALNILSELQDAQRKRGATVMSSGKGPQSPKRNRGKLALMNCEPRPLSPRGKSPNKRRNERSQSQEEEPVILQAPLSGRSARPTIIGAWGSPASPIPLSQQDNPISPRGPSPKPEIPKSSSADLLHSSLTASPTRPSDQPPSSPPTPNKRGPNVGRPLPSVPTKTPPTRTSSLPETQLPLPDTPPPPPSNPSVFFEKTEFDLSLLPPSIADLPAELSAGKMSQKEAMEKISTLSKKDFRKLTSQLYLLLDHNDSSEEPRVISPRPISPRPELVFPEKTKSPSPKPKSNSESLSPSPALTTVSSPSGTMRIFSAGGSPRRQRPTSPSSFEISAQKAAKKQQKLAKDS